MQKTREVKTKIPEDRKTGDPAPKAPPEKKERLEAVRTVFNRGGARLRRSADALRDGSAPRIAAAAALASGAGLAACFAALCRLSFGCYPVGVALICAAGVRRSPVKALSPNAFCASVIAGSLISCLFVSEYPFAHFAVYACAFIVRLVITGGRLDESRVARTAVCAFSASLCALIRAAFESFSLSSLFMLLTFSVLSPVICYVLCGVYAERSRYIDRECGYLAAASLLIYSVSGFEFMGFSPAFAAAVVFTFAVCASRGPIYGAVTGLASGLACGKALYGALLGLSGFFGGIFFPVSGLLAMGVGFVISAGFSIFGSGFGGFGAVADDYVAGMGIWYLVKRFVPTSASSVEGLDALEAPVPGEAPGAGASTRLEKLSDAFCSLSRVFYTVSDTMKTPDITETGAMVSECFSRVCSDCRLARDCWKEQYADDGAAAMALAEELMKKGAVTSDDLPRGFRSDCGRRQALTEAVNAGFSSLCSECFNNNRTDVLAGEYSAVARLLKSTAGECSGEDGQCEPEKRRAIKLLKKLGVGFLGVSVRGRREMKIDVFGVLPQAIRVSSKEIREAFQKEFGCTFEDPAFILLEKLAVMRLKRKRGVVLECAKACRAKNGENVNGDAAGFFESDSDRFYSMICDGMGSGRDAAVTSRLAQIFIEKLLSCSSPDGLTFEMLNSFLLAKNDECFTTVDLLEVDLLSGEGSFIKAGAAPSYVVRGDNVFCVESRTPPAGILSRLTAEKTALELRPGDTVVMISDGVSDGSDAQSWLTSRLAWSENREPAALASAILREASDRKMGKDDMTVFVISVKEAV